MTNKSYSNPYQKIMDDLDILVKSRFIEMFGSVSENKYGWPISTLGKICNKNLSYGSTASAIDYDGAVRYVRITDITDKGTLANDVKSPSKMEEKYILCDGDVLFARSGATVGKTFQYNSKDGLCVYAGYLIRLIPNADIVNPSYVYHFTQSEDYINFINNVKRGAAQPNINAQQYSSLKIVVPPIELQNQFAEFVKQVDKSKLILEKCIKKYDQLIKSRFIEMFGDIIRNEKSWKVVELGKIGEFKTGGTPSSKHPEYFEGDLPWISSTALGSNYIDRTSAKYLITEDAIRNSATSLIPAGSLIVGTRINVGKSSINTDPICTCQDVTSLFDIDHRFDLLFLKHCLDKYTPYLDSQKKGATIKGITSDLLKSVKIPLPSLDLQKEYSDFVKQVDKSKFE